MPATRGQRWPKFPPLQTNASGERDVYAFVIEAEVIPYVIRPYSPPPLRMVTILCPFCGETHHHEAGAPLPDEKDQHPGRRVPHCKTSAGHIGQYLIVVPKALWKAYAL